MTTVSTPGAAGGTVAVGGAPPLPVAEDLVVLAEPVARPEVADVRDALPGDRLRRLEQRRRLVREELLAVMFLVVALAIVVGVLALQWLGSGGPAS